MATRHDAAGLLACLLAASLAGGLRAGEPETPAPNTGEAPKKQKGARSEGRASKKGAPDKADAAPDALTARVLATARAAFVTVHVTFRKDPAEIEGPSTAYARSDVQGPEDVARELAHRFVDDERPLDLPGLWLDPDGTVLVADLGVPTRFIDAIEVRAGDGRAFKARPQAVLRDAPGWLLAATLPAGARAPAPAFADPGPVGTDTEFTAAWIDEVDGVWSLSLGAVGGATRPLSGADGPSWLIVGDAGGTGTLRPPSSWAPAGELSETAGRPFYLLFNDEAVPVGVALQDRLPADPKDPPAWRGPALRRAQAVPFDDLQALERTLVASAEKQIVEVRLTFRMDAPEDAAEGMSPWPSRPFHRDPFLGTGMQDDRGREMTVYGLAVTPSRMFVPAELNETAAARIERIDVSRPGRAGPVPGRFAGSFKAFAGYLVETAAPVAEPPADLFAAEALPRVRPIPTLRVVQKYGRRTPVFGYARIVGVQRGYKHQLHAVAEPAQAPGTFLFDLDGRPAGFVTRLRRDDEKVRALRNTDRGGYEGFNGLNAEDNRLLLFRDVRAALADPASAVDPDIRVKTKFEERRLVWLGVETCLLNRELTRQLGIEGPTKSGQVGAMVVDIYDGSPAQHLGLKDGDILLAVREKGGKEPVEFRFNEPDYGFHPHLGGAPAPESEEELWLAEPPWHSQRNPLNLLLTTIGKGKTVVLDLLVGGKETTRELVLEEGPPDYESAERKKHEETGLTVRDLTYEVRHALHLPPTAPGVVVSRVEEGSPAAAAKIQPYDVLQRIEGRDVKGAADFMAALEAARRAGAATVKVQILRLNRTRYVDLGFEADGDKAPAAR